MCIKLIAFMIVTCAALQMCGHCGGRGCHSGHCHTQSSAHCTGRHCYNEYDDCDCDVCNDAVNCNSNQDRYCKDCSDDCCDK